MMYLQLFLGFLRVGLFSFGGAYSAIPIIRDVVVSYGWLSDESLSYMIAVSESTPGPIMVNLATYIGSSQGGVLGAALATFAVVLPAFVIILLLMVALKHALQNPYVTAAMDGLKHCVIGIIMAMGIYMTFEALQMEGSFDWKAILIGVVLAALLIGSRIVRKKKMSPILLIAISAVLGAVVYSV